jgi:hypothetical protein
LIQNGQVATTNKSVETIDQREITGILQYFNRTHQLSDLEYLPVGFEMSQMKEIFGFSEVYITVKEEDPFYYSSARNVPLTINGFAYLFPLEIYDHQSTNENTYERELTSNNDTLKLIIASESVLRFYINDKILYQYDLMSYFEELYNNYGINMAKTQSPDATSNEFNNNLIFTDENESIKIKIVFYSINGTVELEKNDISINHIQGDVFITVK